MRRAGSLHFAPFRMTFASFWTASPNPQTSISAGIQAAGACQEYSMEGIASVCRKRGIDTIEGGIDCDRRESGHRKSSFRWNNQFADAGPCSLSCLSRAEQADEDSVRGRAIYHP
jgi:hypothetical protein